VTTPFSRAEGGRRAIAWLAPRNLKAPVFWKTSALKKRERAWAWSWRVVSEFMDLLVRMGVLWRADWISEYASEMSPGESSGPWEEELAGGGIVEGGVVERLRGRSRGMG
jgi:hypothetical protein